MEVTLKISDDNGQSYVVPVDSVAGDVGYPVLSGTNKQMRWYFDLNTSGISSDVLDNFKAKIVADDRYELDIHAIVDQIDTLNLKADMAKIQGIRHRTAGATHLETVKQIIQDRFKQNNLQVRQHLFEYNDYQAMNIIGRLPGQIDETATYILDGHFDTVSISPGADDNGSAVVGLLEAVRVLSAYNFANTIQLVSFDLEEIGRIGSKSYVAEAIQPSEQIEGVFNFEMIGYYSNLPGSQMYPTGFDFLFPEFYALVAEDEFRGNFITIVGNEASNKIRSEFEQCAQNFVPELRALSLAVPGNSEMVPDLRRSDHAPFWDAGYPALMLTDGADFRNPNYHQPSDTMGTLHFEFMCHVIQATVATIAKMAEPLHCGMGIFEQIELSQGSVAQSNNIMPVHFLIEPNYPNPFNPSTKLRYEVPSSSKVRMDVYNLTGRHIVQLVNRVHASGMYEVEWNGLTDSGIPVPSGMYVVQIQIEQDGQHISTQSIKMMLTK